MLRELPECLLRTNLQTALVPEIILERKYMKKQNKEVTMWLIKWLNKPEEDASWEEAKGFKKNFPKLNHSS